MRKLLLYSAIVLVTFFQVISLAQPKILSALKNNQSTKNYILSTWTSKNGLPQNTVMAIQQDKYGFIWLATFDGLARFDGVNFKLYSVKEYPELKSNRLITLHIDSNNIIWISNELGRLITFDGKKFKDVTQEFKTDFLYVYNIKEDKHGMIYFRSYERLLTYSSGKTSIVIFPNKTPSVHDSVLSISYLPNDTLMVFQRGMAHKVLRGKVIKSVDLGSIRIFDAIKTNEGYYFNQNFHLYFSKTFEGLKKGRIVEAPERRANLYCFDNKLYATTIRQGIYEVTNSGAKTILSKEEVPYKINYLFKDKEDNLWIGTGVNGLMLMRKKFLYTLNRSFGITETNTYPILQASDRTIWIGQNAGLQRIVGNKIVTYTDKYGFYNNSAWGLAEDKDKNIWVAVNGGGLFKFNGKSFENYSNRVRPEAGAYLFSLFNDSKNRLWIGSVDCITKYENNRFEFYHPTPNQKNIFRNFIEDENGIIWVASDQGVLKLDGNKFVIQEEFGLQLTRALYIDKKKRLWVGSYGNGIAIKDHDRIIPITKHNGLFSDIVSAIVEDGKGNFWFTSNNGLFQIKETAIDKYISGEQQFVSSINYGFEEDLENTEFNGGCQPNWMRDDEGNIWFPSFAGPVIMQVSALRESKFQSKLFIENLILGNKTYYSDEDIVLPSDYSRFTINYNAPSFSSSNNVRFRYKLSGVDKEWVDVGNQRSITFQKLPYGSYEFELLASDNKGNLSSKPAIIRFRVTAKLYESPFFYLFLLAVLLSVVAYLFVLRLRIGRKREERLESIVADRTYSLQLAKEEAEKGASEEKTLRSKTEEENRQKNELLRIVSHDLKNPLSAIQGFVEILLEDGVLNSDDKGIIVMIDEAAQRIKELITQLLNFSRFEGENFTVLKSSVNVIKEVDKIIDRFVSAANKKDQTIIKDYRMNKAVIFVDSILFSQIVENLISNALKYSDSGKEIKISLTEDEKKVFITVKDYGQGFSETDKKNMFKPFVKLSSQPTAGELSTGLGLTIVKKFVELNDGALHLESEKGVGSEFTIEFNKANRVEVF